MTEAMFGNDEDVLDDIALQQQTGMPQQDADNVDAMADDMQKWESVRKGRLAGANGRH